MAKYKIILNPTSSRGSSLEDIPTIRTFMEENGLDYDLVLTEARMHAKELAMQAHADGYDYIVAAGGDGTANEVINGVVEANQKNGHKAVLAVLPVGSGNDFAFGLGLNDDLMLALETLKAQNVRPLDVGFVKGGDYPEGRYFGNSLGVGFDAIVGFEAAKLKFSGFSGYLVSALKTIFLMEPSLLRLEYDGNVIESKFLMISVMNGRRQGGGFMMTPDAENDDGEFSICITGEMGRLGQLSVVPRFMNGTHVDHKHVTITNASNVRVTSLNGAIPSHMDGETVCEAGQQLEINILPGALQVLKPLPEMVAA